MFLKCTHYTTRITLNVSQNVCTVVFQLGFEASLRVWWASSLPIKSSNCWFIWWCNICKLSLKQFLDFSVGPCCKIMFNNSHTLFFCILHFCVTPIRDCIAQCKCSYKCCKSCSLFSAVLENGYTDPFLIDGLYVSVMLY